MGRDHTNEVYVWDPLVRVFHWALVVAFTIAFVTEDDALDLHVWAGYTVGALVFLRIVWGFIGPEHARFSNFVYRPKAIMEYIGSLLTFRAKRYLGHSPGGGAMVVVLLLSLAVTVASGIVVYGAEERAGPLAGFFAEQAVEMPFLTSPARASEDDEDEGEREGSESPLGEAMEEFHEFFANFTLALVLVHVAAVLLASFVHRENLTKAMFTGYKRR